MEASRETNQEGGDGGGGGSMELEPPPTTTVGGSDVVYKKGAWSKEEDDKLRRAVEEHGLRNWVAIEKYSGLARPAKNCRLRWLNYLRPNLKKHPFTEEEEQKILHLHAKYGNSWSRIASKLPGRSDNDIKNFWHKRAKKCQKHHLPIYPQTLEDDSEAASDTNDENSHHQNNINPDNNATSYSYGQTLPSPSGNYSPKPRPYLQQNVLNSAWYATDASSRTSIYSPHTPVSTPQQHFLFSPSTLTTSYQQSPHTSFTKSHTCPNTPTSHAQNFLLSPHQSTGDAPLIPQTSSNVFTPLRKPPILSSPQGRFRRFSTPTSQMSNHLPTTDSPVQQCSLAMDSPKSPLKLKLSPGGPAVYSVQMGTPTTDSLKLSPGGPAVYSVQMGTPTTDSLKPSSPAPVSPLKLRLSIPASPDSWFKPNISTPDSTVEHNSCVAASRLPSPLPMPPTRSMKIDPDYATPLDSSFNVKTEPLAIPVPVDSCFKSNSSIPDSIVESNSSPQSKSPCNLDLSPIEPMEVETHHVNPLDPSFNVKTESLPVRYFVHGEETYSNLDIIEELKEAQERVKILKKKLRQRRISNKRTSQKESSRKGCSLSRSISTPDLTGSDRDDNGSTRNGQMFCSRTKNWLGESLNVNAPYQYSTTKDTLIGTPRRKDETIETSTAEFLRHNSEGEKYMQESIDIEELIQVQSSATKSIPNESFQREHPSREILMRKNSMIFQEQSHSVNLLDHLNSQNTANGSYSNLSDNKLWAFQVPAGKCSNDCSSMDCLLSESSTLPQDSFLIGDLFDQNSGTEGSLSSQGQEPPAFGPVYSQSIAPGQLKSGDEGGHLTYLHDEGGFFSNSFGQEPSHGPERKGAESALMDGNMLAPSAFCELSVSQQQYPTTDLLDSGYSGFSEFHQYPASSLLDTGYLVGSPILEPGYPSGEPYPFQNFAAGFFEGDGFTVEYSSSQSWKQEPSQERNSKESLLVQNVWPEEQMASQKHHLPTEIVASIANPSTITRSTSSNNRNGESGSSHTGEVLKEEMEDEYKNTMAEELSSLLEFFPTSIQTLEWYNDGDVIPDREAFDEFNKDHGLNMSSTSLLPLTIADYM